jgi:hypothetical protein
MCLSRKDYVKTIKKTQERIGSPESGQNIFLTSLFILAKHFHNFRLKNDHEASTSADSGEYWSIEGVIDRAEHL